jgi:hypothetical protein
MSLIPFMGIGSSVGSSDASGNDMFSSLMTAQILSGLGIQTGVAVSGRGFNPCIMPPMSNHYNNHYHNQCNNQRNSSNCNCNNCNNNNHQYHHNNNNNFNNTPRYPPPPGWAYDGNNALVKIAKEENNSADTISKILASQQESLAVLHKDIQKLQQPVQATPAVSAVDPITQLAQQMQQLQQIMQQQAQQQAQQTNALFALMESRYDSGEAPVKETHYKSNQRVYQKSAEI